MEEIAGMAPTGRRVAGSEADLVEAMSKKGLKHTIMVFRDEYRDHPALDSELQTVMGFLEKPGITGLAALTDHLPDLGAFVYPTGTCWTVGEVIRGFADMGESCGVKAGMEMCYLVGEILSEAAESACQHGLECHGAIDPHRILIKADGQVKVVGYGIPPVGMRIYLSNKKRVPREDSFRYAPPERFKKEEEDLTSDLYSLALVGLEMMIGRPAYDGLVDDILQQASRGESVRRLYQWREKLPPSVREVLGRALKPDPDTRYRDGADFVYAVHDVLSSVDADGPSLVEVMAKLRAHLARGRALESGLTGQLTKEEMAELAGELDADADRALPPPRLERPPDPDEEPEEEEAEEEEQPRWGSVKRARSEPAEPEKPSSAKDLRDRLRRSSRRGAAKDEPTDAKSRLRDRLKGKERGENKDRDRLRRRRREEPTEEADAPPARERPRRRPTRRSAEDVAPAEPAEDVTEESPEAEPEPPEDVPEEDDAVEEAVAPEAEEPEAVAEEDDEDEDASEAEPEDEAPEAPPEEEKRSSGAAAKALLARLKSRDSTDSRRRRRPPERPVEAEPPPAPPPEVAEEPVAEEPVAEEPVAEEPVAEEPPSAPEVDDAPAPPSEAEAAPPVAPATEIPTSVDAAGFPETDLVGNLVAWHRGEGPSAQRIENRIVLATFEIEGVEPAARFQAPVGTAVPAQYVLRTLRRWLALPTADWTLAVDGRTLAPSETLGEVGVGDKLVIVVSM